MGKKQKFPVATFRTADDVGGAPGPHVAIVGRSNVGKSSILNALLKRKIASVSKSPGRTKLIQLYPFRSGYLADLPGYGYAKVGQSLRHKWDAWVGAFYQDNPNLVGTVILVDGRHPGTERDLELHDWMESLDRPYVVVLTKWDLVKNSQKKKLRNKHAEIWMRDPQDMLVASSKSGDGLARVVAAIDAMMHGA